jgi:hypothetical protein
MVVVEPRHVLLPIALFFALLIASRWLRNRHP